MMVMTGKTGEAARGKGEVRISTTFALLKISEFLSSKFLNVFSFQNINGFFLLQNFVGFFLLRVIVKLFFSISESGERGSLRRQKREKTGRSKYNNLGEHRFQAFACSCCCYCFDCCFSLCFLELLLVGEFKIVGGAEAAGGSGGRDREPGSYQSHLISSHLISSHLISGCLDNL